MTDKRSQAIERLEAAKYGDDLSAVIIGGRINSWLDAKKALISLLADDDGQRVDELKAERDEWKDKALDYEHRLDVELACSDKSIIEALESHNRDLKAERDEWKDKCEHYSALADRLTEAICGLAWKQPYTFDPEAPYENTELVANYIDELESKEAEGPSNLEWIFEHDTSLNRWAIARANALGYVTDGVSAGEWLLSQHVDRRDDQAEQWQLILSRLRRMDDGSLVPYGNGVYRPDTRHSELANDLETMLEQDGIL